MITSAPQEAQAQAVRPRPPSARRCPAACLAAEHIHAVSFHQVASRPGEATVRTGQCPAALQAAAAAHLSPAGQMQAATALDMIDAREARRRPRRHHRVAVRCSCLPSKRRVRVGAKFGSWNLPTARIVLRSPVGEACRRDAPAAVCGHACWPAVSSVVIAARRIGRTSSLLRFPDPNVRRMDRPVIRLVMRRAAAFASAARNTPRSMPD
jgi:hypothetical protein